MDGYLLVLLVVFASGMINAGEHWLCSGTGPGRTHYHLAECQLPQPRHHAFHGGTGPMVEKIYNKWPPES